MRVFVYDGSFEGILSAVFEAWYGKMFPDRLEDCKCLQQNILDEYVFIKTDRSKSDRVYKSIPEKISLDSLKHIYNVFLSTEQEPGTLILKYLKTGYRLGAKVDLHLTDDIVFKVHNISRQVELERHRMLGFVRFKQLEGNVYYAPISPDNNIIELLAPHFAERLACQRWIIHDVRRGLAILFNGHEWIVSDLTTEELPEGTLEEASYQKLWKGFFDTIAIKSRINPRLQRQLMPRRYWKYLTEKM